MLRYLALCLVLASAYGFPKAENQLQNYASQTRAVRKAALLLEENVKKLKNYTSPRDQSVQYFSLLYTVYKTADALVCKPPNLSPKEALLNSLSEDLSMALLVPLLTTLELVFTSSKTLERLKPILDLEKELCGNLGDNDCNRVVDAAVKQDPELQKLSSDLRVASKAAKGLLAKEPRLQEVAASRDVVPYLLSNSKDVLDYVKDLRDLLQLFKKFCPYNN